MTHAQRMIDLIDQLETIYTGSPWFGPSWLETLSRVPQDAHTFRLQAGPSIAGSLLHVVAWRIFVTRKLQGQESYELSPDADWPAAAEALDWESLIHTFAESQRELLEALTEFPDSMLDEEVPGRGYSWAFMIQGLVNHDVYHMAQINLLVRQLPAADS